MRKRESRGLKQVVGSRKSEARDNTGGGRKARRGTAIAGTVGSALLPLISCILLFSCVNQAFSQSRLELGTKLFETNGNSSSMESTSETGGRKSPTLAAIASFAIPGLGELYAGRYDIGKYSTIAEISLWAIYTGVELYSNQVRNDAISYAQVYAGADVSGKSSQFFVDMGNFLNTNDYNVKKIHDGYYGLIYSGPSYQWQWASDADRARFKNLRIKADTYLNYGRYTLAAIFLNHLVSAIDAARLVANLNASAETSLGNSPNTEGVYLKLAASF